MDELKVMQSISPSWFACFYILFHKVGANEWHHICIITFNKEGRNWIKVRKYLENFWDELEQTAWAKTGPEVSVMILWLMLSSLASNFSNSKSTHTISFLKSSGIFTFQLNQSSVTDPTKYRDCFSYLEGKCSACFSFQDEESTVNPHSLRSEVFLC